MNGDIFAFTLLLCVVACVVSGIAPAWHTARAGLNDALQAGGRSGSAGRHSGMLRGLLVVSEVALALVAIIGAGLFARSFQLARQIHPGFDAKRMLVSSLSLSTAGYQVPDRRQFCSRLREHLEAQPGIVGVTYADLIPLGLDQGSWEELEIEGYEKGRSENMQIYRNMVAAGYFKVLGIPLLEGRDFTAQDDGTKTSKRVMIVNQTFARRYFGGGKCDRPAGARMGRVVHGGRGGEGQQVPHAERSRRSRISTYRSSRCCAPTWASTVYVRTAGDPNLAVAALRREVRSMDPNVGVNDAMPLTEFMGGSLFVTEDCGLAAIGAGRGGAGAGGGRACTA